MCVLSKRPHSFLTVLGAKDMDFQDLVLRLEVMVFVAEERLLAPMDLIIVYHQGR